MTAEEAADYGQDYLYPGNKPHRQNGYDNYNTGGNIFKIIYMEDTASGTLFDVVYVFNGSDTLLCLCCAYYDETSGIAVHREFKNILKSFSWPAGENGV